MNWLARLALIALVLAAPLPAHGWPWQSKWRDVTPEERALAAPRIDPQAGAEYLLCEMEVDDSNPERTTYFQYLRLKVFDERGASALQQMLVMANWEAQIDRIGARIIRPDGTTETLDNSAFMRRDLARRSRDRLQARSFAVSNLTPGTIIEYQFRQTAAGLSAGNIPWIISQDLPIHVARFRIRPFTGWPHNFVYSRLGGAQLRQGSGGFYEIELSDLPAVVAEPFSPPLFGLASWIIVNYHPNRTDRGDFWTNVGRHLDRTVARDHVTPRNRAVREKAAELTAGATSNEDKIRRIYEFCVTEIRNRTLSKLPKLDSIEAVEAYISASSPENVLRIGRANSEQINFLFASLASAAGLEVKLGLANNRALVFFERAMSSFYGLPALVVAVNDGDRWLYLAPGIRHLPFGELPWEHEGVPVLLQNNGPATFASTPASTADSNRLERQARLVIDADGTLSGTVELRYHGQLAILVKRRMERKSGTKALEEIQADILRALPGAEIDQIFTEGLLRALDSPAIRFRISVPGYASVAGDRLFVVVNPFEAPDPPTEDEPEQRIPLPYHFGEVDDLLVRAPRFTAETRAHSLYFTYSFTVKDDITLRLPAGFELENPSAPASIVDNEQMRHAVRLRFARDTRELMLTRDLMLRGGVYAATRYPQLKDVFDDIHTQDRHLIALRRTAPVTAGGTESP